MPRRANRYVCALFVGTAAGLLAAWLCYPSARAGLVIGQALWRAEWTTYDWRLAYATRPSVSPDIVLVTIGENTLVQPDLGTWPLPRRFHARVIDKLRQAGARVIGLDIVLEGHSGVAPGGQTSALSPDDRALAAAIKRAGNVVLAMEVAREGVPGQTGGAQLWVGHFPLSNFEDAARALACTDLPLDQDGVVRRYWVSREYEGEVFPTMALALASAYSGQSAKALGQRILATGRANHPVLHGNSFLLHFRVPIEQSFVRIPYQRVFRGDFDPAKVRGKLVLVGATATLLHDLYATPVALRSAVGAGQQVTQMPGVEILANAADTVLHNDPVLPVSPLPVGVATVLVAILTALLLFRMRPLKALFLVWLPVCVLAAAATYWAMWARQTWVPLMPFLLGATLSYGFGTIYLELTVEREQARLRRAWSMRVSPEVLQVLLSNPGLAQIRGRRVTGTVFFSDLADFTAFCHSCPPEMVVQRINEYLELATRVIRDHGGTIHKFIGDGVMAVFGDPVPQEDHAARAIAAAIDLQRKMAELRSNLPDGAWPMFMRIGLCTGELVAGDIGSEQLLEYTVMGDTVSTASRLEALNKEFGTAIMLSGATAAQAGGRFDLASLGSVQVRGRAEPIDVYTVREEPPSDEP